MMWKTFFNKIYEETKQKITKKLIKNNIKNIKLREKIELLLKQKNNICMC